MLRLLLIAITLLVAAHQMSLENWTSGSVTGHVVGSVFYALSPAILAAVVAGLIYLFRRKEFARDFHWAWGLFLAGLAFHHAKIFIGTWQAAA